MNPLDAMTVRALDQLDALTADSAVWGVFEARTQRYGAVLNRLDDAVRATAHDPAQDVLDRMEAEYTAAMEQETAPMVGESEPEPEPTERTATSRGKGRKPRRYKKRMDAAKRIARHLAKYPSDINLGARELADKIGVGKTTVNDYVRTLKHGTD